MYDSIKLMRGRQGGPAYRQAGFIDLLSLISLGFLVVTILVGTIAVNKQNANYDIKNKAAMVDEPCKICDNQKCVSSRIPKCSSSLNECSRDANCKTTTPPLLQLLLP